MIAEILHWLGVGGSIATVVSAGIMLYHGRELLKFAARFGVWVRMAGLVGFVVVLAASGIIPGVSLSVNLGALWGALTGLYEWLPMGRIL